MVRGWIPALDLNLWSPKSHVAPFPPVPSRNTCLICMYFIRRRRRDGVFAKKELCSFDHSLFSQHSMTMTQTQNISFASFPGCLNRNLSLRTHFHRGPQYAAGDTGRGGEPDSRLYEDSPTKEKRLHLTSAKRCTF